MKPIVFHPEARAEFDAAAVYYEQQREGLGLEFQEEVEAGVERIQQFPGSFPLHGQTGRRKHVLHRFPYTIFYLELDDSIWIAAVAHQKRRPGYWMDREPS